MTIEEIKKLVLQAYEKEYSRALEHLKNGGYQAWWEKRQSATALEAVLLALNGTPEALEELGK